MDRRLLPLNALMALEAVLRTGSIRAAAKELGVTPSAVSQHVSSLEQAYEVGLLARRTNGVRVTVAGQRLMHRLTECFDALEDAAAPLLNASPDVEVVLSVLPSLARAWVLPLLPTLQRRFPHIEWTIRTETRLADFRDDDVDLGIRYCVQPDRNLVSARLFGEEVFPVGSPALAQELPLDPSLRDLASCRLLHDTDAAGRGDAFDWDMWLADAGIKQRSDHPDCRFSDASLLLDAAEAGLGIALARSPLVRTRLREGRLVRLGSEVRSSARAYFVVTSRRNRRRSAVSEVFDWLCTVAAP